jgi:acetyl-CoA decarbonylase/synthase complex subunit gamma
MAMRWGIGRDRYAVPPGLYAVGNPGEASPLVATANYKLSFDHLRRALAGVDAWVMVLDTKGINVWCAAGKGTFGTEEVVRRLAAVDAGRAVTHATLILPQLGGPGVSAHEVRRQSGFKVVYGPVRAADLPTFVRNGMRATPAMRRVTFTLRERFAVAPIEAVQRFVPTLVTMLLFFLAAGVGRNGYRVAMEQWPRLAVAVWANFLAGVALTPALLPALPGRAFAVKGAAMGLLTGVALWWLGAYRPVEGAAIAVLSVAVCSFLGLMFTGCTPYTSPSGVRREMPWALRLQIAGALVGLALWFAARFV